MVCSALAAPIEHWTHSSGAQVYLVQSPSIPMLDLQVEWDAGSRRDPPAKAGLAAATASVLGKGVATQGKLPALTENALGQAWADLGAGFEADAGDDRFSVSLRTLTEPDLLAKSIALTARILGAPSWPQAVWQRERARWVAAIQEANTQPATAAERAFAKAVYGAHPYGFDVNAQTLAAISVKDMANFYRQSVAPCNAKVNIVGAVTRERADALVTDLFAGFAKSPCRAQGAVAEVAALTQANEQRIPFEAAQAQVLIGQPGYKRNDPDFFAMMVGNYILGGGGFVSRLNNEVREKRGLSYSVYSYFSPGLHAGAFTLGLQTKPDQANQALQVAREVLQQFVQGGITDAELKAAKDYFINGFALRLDSNQKLLNNIASISWNQLPLNYLDTWTQQIENVTVQQVREAFVRKLQPDRMVTVVVGAKP